MAPPFFFAVFLCADFTFRLRIAFFVVALRFLGMILPFRSLSSCTIVLAVRGGLFFSCPYHKVRACTHVDVAACFGGLK